MIPGPDGTDPMGPAGRRTVSGTGEAVPEWIRRLRPTVPPEVAGLLVLAGDGPGGAAAPSTETLAEGAVAALERALSGPLSRDAAWHLLGADALLTCACETALDGPRVHGTLEILVRWVLAGPERRKEARDRD